MAELAAASARFRLPHLGADVPAPSLGCCPAAASSPSPCLALFASGSQQPATSHRSSRHNPGWDCASANMYDRVSASAALSATMPNSASFSVFMLCRVASLSLSARLSSVDVEMQRPSHSNFKSCGSNGGGGGDDREIQ